MKIPIRVMDVSYIVIANQSINLFKLVSKYRLNMLKIKYWKINW